MSQALATLAVYLLLMGIYYRHLAIVTDSHDDRKELEFKRDEMFARFIIVSSLSAVEFLIMRF